MEKGRRSLMNNYGLRFRKGDVEIEIQGDKNFVEKKFEELYSKIFGAIVPAKQKILTEVSPIEKIVASEHLDSKDLREYMKKFRTTNNTEKMMVAARYLYERLNKKSFTLFDIKSIYKIMRWQTSKNPSSFLQKFRQKKYIYLLPQKRDGKPLYVLTEKGIKFTETLRKRG